MRGRVLRSGRLTIQPVRDRNRDSEPSAGSTESNAGMFQREAGTKPRTSSFNQSAPAGLSTRSARAVIVRTWTFWLEISVDNVRVKRSHSSR